MSLSLEYWQAVTPDELFRSIAQPENREHVIAVLNTLTPDPVWMNMIIEWLKAGRIEIRCFASWLARQAEPRTYLEVGVRRGFTMATVASHCPNVEIYGFDMWVKNYANTANPGPRFVQGELEKAGYKEKAHFIGGDSHKTLPLFFGKERGSLWGKWTGSAVAKSSDAPKEFDFITIDGDHSLLGAYQDLVDTMPYCAVGGVLLFDDIVPDLSGLDPEIIRAERGKDPHGWGDLLGVWRAVEERFPNFRFFTYTVDAPGVGLAVRLS